MPEFDVTTEFGQRVLNQLQTEQIVWLTTVSPNGQPQPSPVWFIWRDGELVIFSEPATPKVRNIRANPKVALSFNADFHGNEITILQGRASLRETPASAEDVARFTDYTEKYAGGIESLKLTPESMLAQFSQIITVTPTSFRGW